MTENQQQVDDTPKQAMPLPNEYQQKKELKHASYIELKRDITEVANVLMEQKRMIQSQHVLMKNYLARQEAFLSLLIQKGLFTESEFDAKVDENLGLRLRAADEEIQIGDVAWVDYTATITGTDKNYTDNGLPVRVGSRTVVFDGTLIGKKVGETFEFRAALKHGADAGKEVVYSIKILKAKVNIGGGDVGVAKTETQAEAQS